MGEHWYDRAGVPAYTINGRDTTLRDARKFGLLPSVTTVLSCVAKPALTNWMVEQGVLAALTGTRLVGESDDAYIARILADSRQQAIDAANEGSRIHDACEQLVKTGTCPEKYRPHAEAARAELRRLFPNVNDWVAEQSFGHPLGFGGKCDLHSPSTGIIVDYKTKDGDFTDGKRLAYDQHWQLAAYARGLEIQPPHCDDPLCLAKRWAPGAAIFVSRTHPGCVSSHVWGADEMAQGWSTFECALALWRCLKNFDPRY